MEKTEDNKTVYVFKVWDNQGVNTPEKFMLYTIKDDFLKPTLEDFARGCTNFFSFQTMISCLECNKIKTITTYHPNSETVCSQPYELNNEETIEACKSDGEWNRFEHQGVDFSHKEIKILKKYGIELIELNEKEISELEKKLNYYNPA